MATTADSLILFGDVAVDAATVDAICSKYFVARMSVFGSAARGTMTPESDVDLLVEFQPECGVTLFDLARLSDELTELIGRPADIGTRLKPRVHADAAKDLRVVYSK